VSNPLLVEPELPYGLPDFANIEPRHYEEAIMAGLAERHDALAKIADNPEPPTIENTLAPLEQLQWKLHPILGPFHQILWADGVPEIEDINLRIAPKLAAAQDEILMNRPLYRRLEQLSESLKSDDAMSDSGSVSEVSSNKPSLAETKFLLKNWLRKMSRAGVNLDDAAQIKLRDINERLTKLEAKFGKKLLAGNKAAAVLVTDEAELAGLDDEARAAYASAATEQGLTGWLIGLELTTGQQILKRLKNPDLRARIMATAQSRGIMDDENDTRELITQIARLRAEHAALLGYPHHAAYVADNNVIETADAIAELLGQLAEPAMVNTRREAAQLTAESQRVAASSSVSASDWAYLTEQLLRDKFSFDFEQLRPYLELNSVLHNGVFKAAHDLYGLNFVRRPDLRSYHDEVEVYEVFDDDKPQTKNQGRGLVMFDFYARPTKRGGAWMNPIIGQSELLSRKPVITQTLNIVKPADGEFALITWDNVRTLFHEFGHALHGLLSDTYYPSPSGVNVPTDFVEYPSQVNEMWSHDPQIINNFAKHYQTGKLMPSEWHSHLKDTKGFGEGFALTEILGANAIDQAWHRLTPEQIPSPDQVEVFEQKALERAGVYCPAVPPRYRSAYYNHIWGSGYAAGYYSYMLSKMFDADTVTWFKENGGLSRENGRKFAEEVLARGNTRDPKESFRALRGRDVIIEPLLVRFGLVNR